MLDGDETNASDDSDGDETSNILDPDRENDGLFDGTELGLDCSHPATDPEAGLCTPDADAGSTITWMLDAVTDDGGVSGPRTKSSAVGSLQLTVDSLGEREPRFLRGTLDSGRSTVDGPGDFAGTLVVSLRTLRCGCPKRVRLASAADTDRTRSAAARSD